MYRTELLFCFLYYRTRQEASVQLVIIEIFFQHPLVFPCLLSLCCLYNIYSAFSWTSLSDLSSVCWPHLPHLVSYSIRMTVLFSLSFCSQISVFKTKTKRSFYGKVLSVKQHCLSLWMDAFNSFSLCVIDVH